jgi:hypothetical protein
MKDTEQIIELAKLDGFCITETRTKGFYSCNKDSFYIGGYTFDVISQRLPSYLTSRDAIVPVIEKQSKDIMFKMHRWLMRTHTEEFTWLAPASELSEALLRATGLWKE